MEMKGKWKSYIYIPVLACILAVGGMTAWSIKKQQNKPLEKIYYLDEYFQTDETKISEAKVVDEQNVIIENIPESVQKESARFILRMVDNYVMVYLKDTQEHFMSTGICMDELPEETKIEIINGKEILDEEALYFFLESHSS